MAALLALWLVPAATLAADKPQRPQETQPAQPVPQETQPAKPAPPKGPIESETKITPQQAEELFRSVDDILQFASKDSRLPIQHPVKRALADRQVVRQYVLKHLEEDRDAQRLQRSEASLKKFGLVPRDFGLRKFLLDLLEDQVAGYYDAKTKTVYLLDWVAPDAQRPVLAHELTHALQDQNFDLERWLKVRPQAKKYDPDSLDAEPDEEEAARQAVSEGQAMGVMVDYALAPAGITLADKPFMGEVFKQQTMKNTDESPVFAKAPLYLKEMVVFPYVYGLGFLQTLLAKGGREMAFAGAFKNPPRDTREIMEPGAYLAGEHVAPLRLPRLSPILKKDYRGYDSGSVGAFDVYVLLKQYGDEAQAGEFAKAWRGGAYYVTRRVDAKSQKSSAGAGSEESVPLNRLALLYLSRWSSAEKADKFADAYASLLPKKYQSAKASGSLLRSDWEGKWLTEEGPVYIAVAGEQVLVLEGFDDAAAGRLRDQVLAAKKAAWVPQHGVGIGQPVLAAIRLSER